MKRILRILMLMPLLFTVAACHTIPTPPDNLTYVAPPDPVIKPGEAHITLSLVHIISRYRDACSDWQPARIEAAYIENGSNSWVPVEAGLTPIGIAVVTIPWRSTSLGGYTFLVRMTSTKNPRHHFDELRYMVSRDDDGSQVVKELTRRADGIWQERGT